MRRLWQMRSYMSCIYYKYWKKRGGGIIWKIKNQAVLSEDRMACGIGQPPGAMERHETLDCQPGVFLWNSSVWFIEPFSRQWHRTNEHHPPLSPSLPDAAVRRTKTRAVVWNVAAFCSLVQAGRSGLRGERVTRKHYHSRLRQSSSLTNKSQLIGVNEFLLYYIYRQTSEIN